MVKKPFKPQTIIYLSPINTMMLLNDDYFMQQALIEAQYAASIDEIPVGAIVVAPDQTIIARAYNQTEQLKDVTAHAEVLAITAAANYLGSKYLTDCTLYVTLEPCIMCSGALAWSQLGRLVFGASDVKKGFSRFGKGMILHRRTLVERGVLEVTCGMLLTSFFKRKR